LQLSTKDHLSKSVFKRSGTRTDTEKSAVIIYTSVANV